MVTKVGLQTNFLDALKDLLELDFDAIEAYNAAIERLENPIYKLKLNEFKEDHQRHTVNLTHLLNQHNEKAPTGPSSKQWLTKGKVVLANLMGDTAILKAMVSNEIDTNTAYERVNYHEHLSADSRVMLKEGWEDEKRHKEWLQKEIDSVENKNEI